MDAIAADDDLSGNVVWALPDAVGTVRDLLDATGAWVRHRVYDSFGNVVARLDNPGDTTPIEIDADSDWLTVYGWTGRPWDAMAGLSDHR
ncbi:MAG: hypothetical protein MI802_09770, partial [Desulfobacterales bacterium]|nr:hypothetical protein [Desulfobacterales bacterium]